MTERDLRLLLDDAAADEGRSALSAAVLASRARSVRRRRRMAVAGASGAVAALTVGVLVTTATTDVPSSTPVVAKPSPSPTTRTDTGTHSSATCASRIVIDGVAYSGVGGFERTPELTGRTLKATQPGCNDTGGSDAPDTVVTVDEIVGIPTETAVWQDGTVMVRDGAVLPPETDAWRTPPTCNEDGPAVLIGQWLGVEQKREVRFDGDVRPPLNITLYVERTVPAAERLTRWTLRIDDEGDASPGLDKHMIEEALWSSRASLRVTLHCEGKRFVADSFELVPR